MIDDGRTFTAHEVLEAVWKSPETPDAERQLWRGLAQLAVGLTHEARGNQAGADSLLQRAGATLQPYAGTTPQGVAVDQLLAWIADRARGTRPRLVPQVPRPES